MTLTIQIGTPSQPGKFLLLEAIDVPDEIPYTSDARPGDPITLLGLKTAIDYAIFEARKELRV